MSANEWRRATNTPRAPCLKDAAEAEEEFPLGNRSAVGSNCAVSNLRRWRTVARWISIGKPAPWTRHWRKVRESTQYRPPCMPLEGLERGSEDCLYLNIFTQQETQVKNPTKNDEKRAVLVYLISDSFDHNDNSLYQPSYILDQDIVLVTLNYRMGIFGYFTTGDEAAPGNYGLKDVLLGLKWLQKNVAAFGGDPKSVTLMGQGAGAGVVHLLALSKKSEGLFHKYITQSGTALAPWTYRPREKAVEMSKFLISSMKCERNTSKEMVACLRTVPAWMNNYADEIVMNPWDGFGPIDEPESEEAVIIEHPKILMAEGKARDIPWLTGVVADEGFVMTPLLHQNSSMCQLLAENFEETVLAIANHQLTVTDTPAYLESLSSFYFDGNITNDCADGFVEMAGDVLFNWPVFEALETQVKSMKSKVFFYNFAYNGTFTTTFKFDSSQRFGVSHGDDVNYIFPILNEVFDDLQLRNTEDDIAMINVMTEMWGNFVKSGAPSARFLPSWEPYKKARRYMVFGPEAEVSMEKGFLTDRMNFWRKLSEKLVGELNEGTHKGGSSKSADGQVVNRLSVLFVSLAVLLIFRR
ncbi:esterase FE4-like isoform X2 [Athalia rosae]|uniref:esterase FE4-like isoform X2 n=1 Tax=Athalia rosae TaxID=37344 RepID=UPI0020334872|nr:esterase FE4-like isoform X2 [Athalia rosae]